jgi:hypothetical protein
VRDERNSAVSRTNTSTNADTSTYSIATFPITFPQHMHVRVHWRRPEEVRGRLPIRRLR